MSGTFQLQDSFNFAAGQFLVATQKLDRDDELGQSVFLFMGATGSGWCWGVDLTKLVKTSGNDKLFDGGLLERGITVILDGIHGGFEPLGDLGLSFASSLTHERPPAHPENTVRCHVINGHAGWDAGQLVSEIRDGKWAVGPATKELVFDTPPENLWAVCAKRAGFGPR